MTPVCTIAPGADTANVAAFTSGQLTLSVSIRNQQKWRNSSGNRSHTNT